MVPLVVACKSTLRHSQPECGGPYRFGGSKRRQSKPFELTQRRCCRERAEDVPRADDAPTWTSFASVEDGVARQRFRNMRPKACPPDVGGFEVASNDWEHLVQRWEILASDQHKFLIILLIASSPVSIHVVFTVAARIAAKALVILENGI